MIWLIDYDVNSISDQSFSFCIFKNVFSEECYGCGLLRGLSAALHLDLYFAFNINQLNIITIPLVISIYISQIVKKNNFYFRSIKNL